MPTLPGSAIPAAISASMTARISSCSRPPQPSSLIASWAARRPLGAVNVLLATEDLAIARGVARAVRASSGGLPAVQALGVPTSRPGAVQVTLTLLDPRQTPLSVPFAAVRAEAARRGVAVLESELVGLAF